MRLAARGDRVEQIRTALGLNGDQFAAKINTWTHARGFDAGFDKSDVSRLESGKMTFFLAEIAAAIVALDPDERGIDWLVYGEGKRGVRPVNPAIVQPAATSRTATRRKSK